MEERELRLAMAASAQASGALPARPFSASEKRVGVTLLSLCSGDLTGAVAYLAHRRGVVGAVSDAGAHEYAAMLEEWYDDWPLDEVRKLCEDKYAPYEAALQRAIVFLREWRLAAWVRGRNDLGVAPPTDEVLRKHDELLVCDVGAALAATSLRADMTKSSNRQWALRWRARFGVAVAAPTVREDVPVEEMRQKVRAGATEQ